MQGIKLERGFGAKHTVFKKHLKKKEKALFKGNVKSTTIVILTIK